MGHDTSLQSVRLIACPRILSTQKDRIDRYVQAGGSVADHLRAIGWQPESLHARVFIDGEYIEHAQWEYAVPRAGQSFTTRVIPMGGDNGEGKQAGRMMAMIAVMMASQAAASFGGPGAGAAVSILGSLAVNALVPAPLPRRPLPLPVPNKQYFEEAA